MESRLFTSRIKQLGTMGDASCTELFCSKCIYFHVEGQRLSRRVCFEVSHYHERYLPLVVYSVRKELPPISQVATFRRNDRPSLKLQYNNVSFLIMSIKDKRRVEQKKNKHSTYGISGKYNSAPRRRTSPTLQCSTTKASAALWSARTATLLTSPSDATPA